MSDNPSTPLLGGSGDAERSRPERSASQMSRTSQKSKHSHFSGHSGEPSQQPKTAKSSIRSHRSRDSERSAHPAEFTPLLPRESNRPDYGDGPSHEDYPASAAASSLRSLQNFVPGNGKESKRWPTIVALTLLFSIIITILALGFAAPEIAVEYAKEATVFEPTDLSIDSFTSSGIRARIQGDFSLDASRVHKKPVRDLGRFGTWIVKAVESTSSEVDVYLPEYGNVLLGTAHVPGIVVDIRNGHTTHVDFLCDLVAGDVAGVRAIANDWLEGRLGQLRVQGVARVGLKSGLFTLGAHYFSKSVVFEGDNLPSIPEYRITKLNFREAQHGQKGMAADVSLTLANNYPVNFTLPPLGFDIMVQACSPEQPYILLAAAKTSEVEVKPKTDIIVNVGGIIRKLPEAFVTACPESEKSPLDLLLGEYMNGDETTIYVRGSDSPSSDTPEWITDLLKDIVVPLPFPGHSFDSLIRDFSLASVHVSLPDPFADPSSPESQPRLSATVKAVVNIPEEMNFPIEVSRVRADADVFYHKKKLGSLDLSKWQKANSTRIEADGAAPAGLAVNSIVKKAPLNITDEDVFADLVQELVFGGSGIVLGVKALVDVETETALGKFVVRDLPAEGKVFVKPISSGGNPAANFNPQVGSLQILKTSQASLTLGAKINITNPTKYSATVPYIDINVLSNDTILGHATARDVSIVPGFNAHIPITAFWDPTYQGGKKGVWIGRELLSQYISGYNTTITLRTHAGSIPSHPNLGTALSSLAIQLPTPHLHPPKNPNDDDDDQDPNNPHFIDDATMHLLSSTASLTLLSPLPFPLTVNYLNASASYNSTLLALILYHLPFEIPPGVSTSPRLPVRWSLDDVGYDTVKKALGGQLRIEAKARIGVGIGKWSEEVLFVGRGVGVRVRWL